MYDLCLSMQVDDMCMNKCVYVYVTVLCVCVCVCVCARACAYECMC